MRRTPPAARRWALRRAARSSPSVPSAARGPRAARRTSASPAGDAPTSAAAGLMIADERGQPGPLRGDHAPRAWSAARTCSTRRCRRRATGAVRSRYSYTGLRAGQRHRPRVVHDEALDGDDGDPGRLAEDRALNRVRQTCCLRSTTTPPASGSRPGAPARVSTLQAAPLAAPTRTWTGMLRRRVRRPPGSGSRRPDQRAPPGPRAMRPAGTRRGAPMCPSRRRRAALAAPPRAATGRGSALAKRCSAQVRAHAAPEHLDPGGRSTTGGCAFL